MNQSHNYFKKRLKDFQHTLSRLNLDAFLIENPVDIFYFSGVRLSRGVLYITHTEATLCVDGRYMEWAKKISPFIVRSLEGGCCEKFWNSLSWRNVCAIGFDPEISFGRYKELKLFFSKLGKRLSPCQNMIQKQRAIKDNKELRILRKSAALAWEGFLQVQKRLKVGVTESEVALFFESYCRRNGAEALPFDPIVAFGVNSAFPHHRSDRYKLKRGQVVLMDFGAVVDGYASDMTRTIFFGKASEPVRELVDVVKLAYRKVLQHLRPGVEVAELDHIARTAMGEKEKFFLHSLGHGVGLNIHEYPLIGKDVKNVRLKSRMVITIEPGLYIPEIGGVRHEDMFVITETGYRNILQYTVGVDSCGKRQ